MVIICSETTSPICKMIYNVANTAVLRLFFISISLLLSPISYAQTNITVAAIGDSITAGLMRNSSNVITCPVSFIDAICSGNGVNNIGGYTNYLASEFQEKDYIANVHNWGIGGEQSSLTVNRISNILAISKPQYVTIMTGANDAIFNVSSNTIKFNYQTMVNNILSKGVIPVLGTVTPDPRLVDFEANINKYNVVIKQVALDNNLFVADQFSKMNEDFSAYHSGDLKHFNNLGNEKMAEEWFSVISETLDITVKKITLAPIIKLLLE